MRAREFTKTKISEGVDELFEINMSPKNLERLVADIPDARVGIEFEMARLAFNRFVTNVMGRSSTAGYGYREVRT
jgi:hypothetical protein